MERRPRQAEGQAWLSRWLFDRWGGDVSPHWPEPQPGGPRPSRAREPPRLARAEGDICTKRDFFLNLRNIEDVDVETLIEIVAVAVASAAACLIALKSMVDAVFFIAMALYILTYGFFTSAIRQAKNQQTAQETE
jgi:hypothetical protein